MFRSSVTLMLLGGVVAFAAAKSGDGIVYGEAGGEKLTMDYYPPAGPAPHPIAIIIHGGGFVRSEEHTSELQSLTNLVCRLLLEKKKQENVEVTTVVVDEQRDDRRPKFR